MKKKLTRKSQPVTGSLAWYVLSYRAEGFSAEQAKSMAQLAYGQDLIRKRLDALDAVTVGAMLGVIEIAGDFHEFSCAKREDHDNACDCDAAKEVKR